MTFLRCVFVLLLCVTARAAYAVSCVPGEYADGDVCRLCPVNATCNGADFVCNDGWYKDGAICTPCDINNATCSGPDDYSCLPGYYDKDGACTACPENAVCPGGREYFHCADGYYEQKRTSGELISCMSCDGHVCDGNTLISCGAGYYFYRAGGYCVSCGDYSYCPAGSTEKKCDTGYYYSNASCIKCAAAYYCPRGESNNDNLFLYCAAGYYRAGGECLPCDDGVVCPGGKISEMVCPDGLYKYDNGQCLSRAPGDCGVVPDCYSGCYNAGTGCAACADNSTCTSATDFSCVAGYYKKGDECAVCPNNSTCPAGSTQINCHAGYWLDGAQCASCPTGHYCKDNVAIKCPGIDALELPDGYSLISYASISNDGTGGQRPIDITRCSVARPYVSTPRGVYTVVRVVYNGTHYASTWAWGMYESAAVGYYLDDAVINISSLQYRKSLACTNKPDNSYYTGAGTPGGNDCPWRCDNEYYRDGNACKICPDGQDCLGGVIVCPVGLYADGVRCVPCPAGYGDGPDRGAQSVGDCRIKCAPGTYLAAAGATGCTDVGAGYWGGGDYVGYGAVGERHQCPAGLTTVGRGAGADEVGDCGRVLNIGPYRIYLRTDKKTDPALAVFDGIRMYFGNVSPGNIGRLRVGRDAGTVYSIYDDITAAESD